jgi:hypothetical protein
LESLAPSCVVVFSSSVCFGRLGGFKAEPCGKEYLIDFSLKSVVGSRKKEITFVPDQPNERRSGGRFDGREENGHFEEERGEHGVCNRKEKEE